MYQFVVIGVGRVLEQLSSIHEWAQPENKFDEKYVFGCGGCNL